MRCLLLIVAMLLPLLARADWQQATTKHFIVYADDKPDAVRALADRVERFDQALRELNSVPDKPLALVDRVTVYQVENVSAVQELAGPGVDNVAGFYIRLAEGSVAFVPKRTHDEVSPLSILQHEYSHNFMFTSWTGAAFPAWFVEGFAEFNSTATMRRDGGMQFGSVAAYRNYEMLQSNWLRLDKLLQPNPGKLGREDRAVLYARGWLLTHYLTFDPVRRQQLAAYVVAINQGRSTEEAIKLFGDLSDHELDSYAARKVLPTRVVEPAKIQVGEIAIRALTPAESAMLPARMRSRRGVSEKTAPTVATLARQLAGPYPNDPAAQMELAEAEYDAKNLEAAEAAADRALATDPKAVRAMVYKGMARMAIAVRDKNTDPARWRDIRGWFLDANKADPADPMPLIEFYRSFSAAGVPATDGARNGLLYAYSRAPYDPRVRMMAAVILLQKDKAELARVALRPVAYSQEDDEGSELANKVLQVLDQSGSAAAALDVLVDGSRVRKEQDADKKSDSEKKK